MKASLQSYSSAELLSYSKFEFSLRQAGFDILSGFEFTSPGDQESHFLNESWTSQLLPTWFQLRLQQAPVQALIIGNSRALWPRFNERIAQDPNALTGEHPLDSYVETQIESALAEFKSVVSSQQQIGVGYGHTLKPQALPLQRLAEYAGLAQLGPAGLAIHPTFGPWFALRALVVFESTSWQVPRVQPLLNLCCGCSAPCVTAFERAQRSAQLESLGAHEVVESSIPAGLSAQSRLWLAVRDACPYGREHRYGAAQISYHYDKDPRALVSVD